MNPTRALDRIFATSAFAVLGFLAFLEVSVAANVRVSAAPVAPAAGHRPLVLEATFEQADCALVSKESYTLVYLAGAELPEGTPGDPWLPAKCVGVLIPPETSVRILRVEANEILVAHNVLVYPAQPPVPLSEPRPPFKGPNPASYARKSLVPTEVAEITGHHTLRGYRYATVRLNPVRYIPTTGELYLATEVRVTLLPLSEPRAYVRPARNLHLFRQMVTRLTVNGEMAEGFSGEDSEAITEPVSETTSAVDYLIITSSALAGSFQALANYRAGRNGVTTQVVTVENIYTNPGYAGSDNPTRIRNCIRDYVRNRGTAFVVFGGDNTVVPVRGCYVSCGSYTETAMPTDLYYAGLDSTWDEDGDGVYGEADTAVGDEGDLGPDVIVARIPVRSTAQADAYIGKVVNFEANAVASLKQKAFLGGLKLWDSYSGADRPSDVLNDGHLQFQQHSPVSDGEMWVRRLYRDGIQPWWSVPTLRLFFDTLTSWDSSTAGDYVLNAANLSTRFNEGWFHVYFATHGSTTSWSLESGSYGTANASGLSGLTVFVYTIACLTGGFDSAEPSLSEAFLRNGLGGAIAYFGCSRYGWGSPDSPPASNYSRGGTSMEYGYEFYKQLLTSGQTVMGAVFFLHKAARAGWCGYNGSDRWVQFGLNYQGDPLIDLGEVVTSPTALLGQDTTWVGKLESYTATGAISSDGHPLQYRFDWGNGVTSAWGSATQVCVWEQAGTYNIRAQARCATHPSVQSSWSGVLKTVSVSYCEISGFVRDTDGRGISNVAMNGFLPPTYTAATGFYRGLVPWSWCGTVVPTKAGYVFQPDSRTYTNLAGNKSSEDYVGALMAPAGVTATDGTLTDRVRVTWSAAEGATHYQIYRAASAGGTKIALSGWIPGTSYDDTTAMAGERYWYSVRAAAGTNGESASAYSAEDEGYVASAPCDLVISSISASSSGGAGQAVTVTVATKNQSAVNPAPGSTTRVYFSVDGVLDGGDVGIGECRVPMLGPGGVFTTGVVARLPVGAADGTWYLIAVADADGEVSETVEANNTKSRTIKLGPDLTVTVLTVPSTGGAGLEVVVKDTTRNAVGASPAGGSVTRFWLSANSVLDAGDVVLGSRAVPPLAAGEASSGETVVRLPVDVGDGTWYIIAKADADDMMPKELSETNNTRSRTIKLGPDLTVPSLTAPSVGGAGRDLVVTDTTQNGVLASPAGGSVTRFWLSANSVLDAGDVVLGSRVVPALAAGGSSTANTVVRVPEGVAAGTWYIIAKADADDAMPKELSETNNTKSRTIKIGPDLTVYSFTGPSSAVAGQVITVTVVVKNTGGGDAGASVVRVYFSADAVLDGGDEEVGSWEVGGLAPGASQTCPVVVSVPSGAFPGMWYLIVKADADGEVGETSETNNTRNKTLTVMVP